MAVTEVTHNSWGSRLMGSIKSVLVGIVMFLISFPILFWNEGRAVQTYKSLAEGAAAVLSVAFDKVDSSKEGKLVHTAGLATTDETLTDPDFKVSANAIRLSREVEMYQWEEEKKSEEKKNVGGSTTTTTTYDYRKTWSDKVIDSSHFKEKAGHHNPGSMAYDSMTLTASKVTLGAYTLNPEQVGKISNSTDLSVDAAAVEGLSLSSTASANSGGIYLGEDPGSPAIGDQKVTFTTVPPTEITVVAQQTGSSFQPYQTAAGDALLLVKSGKMTADQIFKAAEADNAVMTWILRFIGWILMFGGLMAIFKPISVFGDVIPMVGSMLGAGLGLFAFLISFGLTLLTVSVAWVFHRPLLGIPLLLLSIGAIGGLVMLGIKKKKARAAAASAAPAV